MTAQPNDRAVEWLAEAMHDLTWQGRQTPPGRSRALAVTALAAIRDALARGGDDADAIAQAIGLRGEDRVRYQGWPIPPERSRRYVTEWREADRA